MMSWCRSIWCLIVVFVLILERTTGGSDSGPPHSKVVFCYLASYATHRPGRGSFKLENVNPKLCTHIVYAFALLNQADDSVYLLEPWSDLIVDQADGRNNITKLKSQYPHLKITVAIGGWLDGSIKYSNMAADPHRRSRFVNSTIEFLKKHDFDGIDIVWQYPGKRGGSRHDKLNFVELVKDLRRAYDRHNFVLSSGLDSSKDSIDYGYEVTELSKHLHYMLLMCYDFNGRWGRFIGHNAPLYTTDLLNTAYAVKYMLKLGADPDKLIMGVPLFGRTFIAQEPIDNTEKHPGLGQKFKNVTFGGPFTQEEGYLGYNEVCLELKEAPSQWKIYWDNFSKVPFAVSGQKFITFDNTTSIREKILFSLRKKLGGIVAWSIDTDDFRGDCQEVVDGYVDYPLLRTVNSELQKGEAEDLDNSLEAEVMKTAEILENRGGSLKINTLVLALSSNLFYYWR